MLFSLYFPFLKALSCSIILKNTCSHKDVKVGKKTTYFDQEGEGDLTEKSMDTNKIATVDQHMALSDENVDGRMLTSGVTKVDRLPKKMHDMTIRDDKVDIMDEKVYTVLWFGLLPQSEV